MVQKFLKTCRHLDPEVFVFITSLDHQNFVIWIGAQTVG